MRTIAHVRQQAHVRALVVISRFRLLPKDYISRSALEAGLPAEAVVVRAASHLEGLQLAAPFVASLLRSLPPEHAREQVLPASLRIASVRSSVLAGGTCVDSAICS